MSKFNFFYNLNEIRGPQGFQGFEGSTITYVGIVGDKGLQGPQGEQGLRGPQSTQQTILVQGSIGTQGLEGAQGLQGTKGFEGYMGSQGPQSSFPIVVNEKGPQGLRGAQGAKGSTPEGIQIGIQGSRGSQGISSLNVPRIGPEGTEGVQGYTGSQGATLNVPTDFLLATGKYSEIASRSLATVLYRTINAFNIYYNEDQQAYIFNRKGWFYVTFTVTLHRSRINYNTPYNGLWVTDFSIYAQVTTNNETKNIGYIVLDSRNIDSLYPVGISSNVLINVEIGSTIRFIAANNLFFGYALNEYSDGGKPDVVVVIPSGSNIVNTTVGPPGGPPNAGTTQSGFILAGYLSMVYIGPSN